VDAALAESRPAEAKAAAPGADDAHMDLSRSRLPVADLRSPASATSDGVILVAAFMLAAAALVHLALTPEHFAEWWVFGALFAIAAGLQLVTAIVLLRTPTRPAIAWTCLINAGIVAVWVLSRATGLPFGPEAGDPEALGWMDVLTTVDELLVIAMLSIEAGWIACSRNGRVSNVCRGCGVALAIVLTLAFAGGVGHV
jgi:hypothetical protein